MKTLAITADDFGADVAVNEAVERGHRDGVLTGASLMVAGAAAEDAVMRAKRMPTLGVGLHIVLVDGRASSPPERIPDLVDGQGRFVGSMGRLALSLAVLPAVRKQVRIEIEAQFAAFAATGLPCDHVNAHKHFQLHPLIGSSLMESAERYGVRAMRVPLEPGRPRGSGWVARPFAHLLARKARRLGFTLPDRVFGMADTGHLDGARLSRLIDGLPDGFHELYLHPGTRDDFAGHGPRYEHRAEFEALVHRDTRTMIGKRDVQLTTLGRVAAARR